MEAPCSCVTAFFEVWNYESPIWQLFIVGAVINCELMIWQLGSQVLSVYLSCCYLVHWLPQGIIDTISLRTYIHGF